jgi:hypothetical protein
MGLSGVKRVEIVDGKRAGIGELKKFFGPRVPGQGLTDFAAEVKELTDADYVEIGNELNALNGV